MKDGFLNLKYRIKIKNVVKQFRLKLELIKTKSKDY